MDIAYRFCYYVILFLVCLYIYIYLYIYIFIYIWDCNTHRKISVLPRIYALKWCEFEIRVRVSKDKIG